MKRIHVSIIFVGILFVIILIRIIIAIKIPVWIDTNAWLDDVLMLRSADIFQHFENWDTFSMTKTMSFPVFLGFVYIARIPYTLAVCLLWVIGSLLALWFFKHFVESNICRLLIFTFILFCPVAFDTWTGLRIYRQAIIAPSALIACMAIFLLVLKIYLWASEGEIKKGSIRFLVLLSIFSGISFFFFYYIKEDGIWLMPVFLIASATGLVLVFKTGNRPRAKVKLAVIVLIPILVFFCGTNIYKAINYHFFGVFEVNTRTEGEFGRFIENLIKIEDENRTRMIWVPYSTLEKAWEVSDTLAAAPEILETIRTMDAFAEGDIEKNPIPGDLISWALKVALEESGHYNSERQAEEFFSKANSDIKAAFNDGRLTEAKGISLSAKVPARTINEILELRPFIWQMFKYQALWHFADTSLKFRDDELVEKVNETLHVNIRADWGNLDSTDRLFMSVGKNIIIFYRTIAPFLICISLAGFVLWIIELFRKKVNAHGPTLWSLMPVFSVSIALSITVLFVGVAWFSEWICLSYSNAYQSNTILNFYSSGAAPLIQVLVTVGVVYFFKRLISFRKGTV